MYFISKYCFGVSLMWPASVWLIVPVDFILHLGFTEFRQQVAATHYQIRRLDQRDAFACTGKWVHTSWKAAKLLATVKNTQTWNKKKKIAVLINIVFSLHCFLFTSRTALAAATVTHTSAHFFTVHRISQMTGDSWIVNGDGIKWINN